MLCIWCHINKLINFENSPFKSFSLINFSIPSDWRQLSSLPKPTTQMKMMEFEQKKKAQKNNAKHLLGNHVGSLDTRDKLWSHV